MTNFNSPCAYIVSVLLLFANLVKSQGCFNSTKFVSNETGFGASKFWGAKAHDVEQCMVLCVRQKKCESINYNLETKFCELNRNVRKGKQTKSYENLYSEFKWWPSEVDKNCYSRPCGDDEVCIRGKLGQTSVDKCSYSCMPFGGRPVCPLPKKGKKGVSNGRTVGSVNVVTCPQRWTGGGNAKCMKDLTWDKDIDECVEIHNHSCKNDTLCSEIGAECIDGKCSCLSGYIYSNKTFMCYEESACGEPLTVVGAELSGKGEVRQYTCGENMYPLHGNGTITCDSDTSSWTPSDFQCGGLRLIPGQLPNMKTMPHIGYLEMFAYEQWKAVAQDHWTWNATMVACRKLGFNYGGTFHKNWVGTGLKRKAYKLEVYGCEGEEDKLEDCPKYKLEDKKKANVIALTCFDYNITEPGNVFLENNMTGAVLVNINGVVGVVCKKDWKNKETEVACKTIDSSWTGDKNGEENCRPERECTTIYTIDIACKGTEPHLFYCENSGWGYDTDCQNGKIVTIECKKDNT